MCLSSRTSTFCLNHPAAGKKRNSNKPEAMAQSSASACLKPKDTATQIKLFFVLGHAAFKGRHDSAMNMFAAPRSLHHSSFAQNAKMFGDIVLRNLEPLRQLADRRGAAEQFLHDAPPRLVPQGFEEWRAAFSVKSRHSMILQPSNKIKNPLMRVTEDRALRLNCG